MARIVEMGSRFADHQGKLSTRFGDIADLIRESHYWAKKEGVDRVSAAHVTRAVKEKIYRVNRIEERLQEMMIEDTLIVNTAGEKVGQVNGLAVLDIGDYAFGKPSRITAQTSMGWAGVVNLERETKMSGKIHEKAILIITSYLGGKYAVKQADKPLRVITFEQLYEMVEGDSATCAELYALLSSISAFPQAVLRRDGLHGPEGGTFSHRRGEPEDRGFLPSLQDARPRRVAGGDNPETQHTEPGAERRRHRGGGEGAFQRKRH